MSDSDSEGRAFESHQAYQMERLGEGRVFPFEFLRPEGRFGKLKSNCSFQAAANNLLFAAAFSVPIKFLSASDFGRLWTEKSAGQAVKPELDAGRAQTLTELHLFCEAVCGKNNCFFTTFFAVPVKYNMVAKNECFLAKSALL